ncbi:MAG TPA: vitamin K epoxide reductase family protein, partial [Gemmatimonadales bacterium]|nr:vitamin K epoxide reductase family protein [Gemmatimonadales bacterium]
ALIGLLGYATLLVVSLLSLQPGFAVKRWPTLILATLAGVGVGFTMYLTYVELFVIHAVCRWCVASALTILAIFVVALLGQRKPLDSMEG